VFGISHEASRVSPIAEARAVGYGRWLWLLLQSLDVMGGKKAANRASSAVRCTRRSRQSPEIGRRTPSSVSPGFPGSRTRPRSRSV